MPRHKLKSGDFWLACEIASAHGSIRRIPVRATQLDVQFLVHLQPVVLGCLSFDNINIHRSQPETELYSR